MISILIKRCESSLSQLSEQNLTLLVNRITPNLYKSFHNIVTGIADVETSDLINDITENHNNYINKIKLDHQEEINKISNQYIDEIHNLSLKMEKIKEDLRYESDIRLENLKNMHNDALRQKDNEKIFYQEELNNLKCKSDNEINYFKNLLEINQDNLDSLKDELFKKKSLTNIAKGNLGENLVMESLNHQPRWADINIEDTSNIKGSADLLVNIPSIDFTCIIEVKNEITIQKGKDILQFDEHREQFFKEHSNSHAILFSLNTERIPNFGSYNIINKNGSFTGYFAKKDMNMDEIKYNFYTFIDNIINYRNLNNKNDNTIALCDNLAENSNLLSEILDDYNKKIKYHQEQINICENYINKLNNSIKNGNVLLKDEGYCTNSTLVCKTKDEKIIELKIFLIENDIFNANYSKSEFKSNWTKKSKENEIFKKEKILFKFNLPKYSSYDNIFDEITK
tara:strand:+ start:381 stop:1745 length:1365 start_codon:yes stop_codon:yes gene_type:complete